MPELQLSGGIMVIGAHAGDAENMAAAVVLKHTRAGFPATIVHLTLGEAGHPRMSPADYAGQRKREVAELARLMGAEAIYLPYKDGLLEVNETVKFEVCDLIRAKKPAVILTHWKGSLHKDHTATYEIVQDAIFYAALPAIRRSWSGWRGPAGPLGAPVLPRELGRHGRLARRPVRGCNRGVGGLPGGAALARIHPRRHFHLPLPGLLLCPWHHPRLPGRLPAGGGVNGAARVVGEAGGLFTGD